jgi:Predicted amidohydrolase
MENLNVAFIQADLIWENAIENRKKFDALIGQVSTKADLILLPETFNTAFPVNPNLFAEALDGASMKWLQDKAREKEAVVCGTLLLSIEKQYYNSLVWMRPDGSFELYHKRHPFSIGGENDLVKAGKEQLLVELKGWKIRPMVCYDLRFPVWARNHYENGKFEYDMALYLANFPDSRMVVWNTLSVARAIENQACMVVVNRIGSDPNGLHYSGVSKAINAKGEILVEAEAYKEVVCECEFDGNAMLRFRQKFNMGSDWDHFQLDV